MRPLLILPFALAACGAPAPDAANNMAAVQNETPPATEDPLANTALPAPESEAFPDSTVISTNEPFWSARIERNTVRLTGVDQPERELTITTNSATPDGRRIVARDSLGSLEATIVNQPCEDSMSGARFPFSGALDIEGRGRAEGCARPGSAPPPAENPDDDSAAATMPPRFVGRWAPDEAACRNPASSIEGLTIERHALRYHESIGVPQRIEREGPNRIAVTSSYDGEGQSWTNTQTLSLSGDAEQLTVTTNGDPFTRIRCG